MVSLVLLECLLKGRHHKCRKDLAEVPNWGMWRIGNKCNMFNKIFPAKDTIRCQIVTGGAASVPAPAGGRALRGGLFSAMMSGIF
jgi:hypothetical protein